MNEGDTSFLKKVDIKEVVDRTPAGLYVDLEKNVLASLIVKGFEAYGLSAQKEDGDTLDTAGVAKFEDNDDAEDGDILTAAAELDINRSGFLFNGL